jgi:chaperonin GroES
MKKVKPLGNRVLIERAKANKTKGGILLPDSAQEKPKEGTVIAVGPGKYDEQGKLQSLTVKIGDRVLFSSYAGTEVKDIQCENGTSCEGEYMILSEEDILGVLVSA